MVHPELERAAFHLEPEVPDGTEGSQKLPVESAVVGLIADRCRAAPTWVALASATRARLAWGDGCDSSATVERLFLAMLKAVSMADDHWILVGSVGEPFKASVRGANTLAVLGRNPL